MAAHVKIYTTSWCGYCGAALSLLKQKGVAYEQIAVDGRPDLRRWLVEATGRTTVPQIFIDDKAVGGYTDIRDLDERGLLDQLLAGKQARASAG